MSRPEERYIAALMPLTPRPTTRPASSKLPSTPCSAAAVASCLPPSLRSFGARQRALMRFGSLQRMRLMAATFPIAAHRGALRHGTAGLPHLPSTAPTGFLDPLTHCSAVQPFQPCFMLVTLMGFWPSKVSPVRKAARCHPTSPSLIRLASRERDPCSARTRCPSPVQGASQRSVRCCGRCYPWLRSPILP
jgi:hypothetical protein